jgi:site-specific DNA recombinase
LRRARAHGQTHEPPNCIAKAISAAHSEEVIWRAVEGFVRDPSEGVHMLAARMSGQAGEAEVKHSELARVLSELDAYQAERDRVVALWRKGRIGERDLDRQRDDIAREDADKQQKRNRIMAELQSTNDQQDRMAHARALLQRLHAQLDHAPITLDEQREAIQSIVAGIRVETWEAGISTRGKVKHEAHVTVAYCFDPPDVRAAQMVSAPAHTLDVSTSAWRWT